MTALPRQATGARRAGFAQGIILLLPISMAVMGISVLAPIVHLLLEQFKDIPNHEYLVLGGVVTMPAIWVLLFSPVAGWLADRFGRRKLLLASMVVYAFVGAAPVLLDNLSLIIVSRIGVGICESVVMTVTTTMIGDLFSGRIRERWLASQTAVASLSSVGIIYAGGQLGAHYGWRGPFYLYLYSLVLAVGVYLLVWEPAVDSVTPGAARQPAAVSFPWKRMLGICALTLLASISFYTIITKNAEALVGLGVSDPAQIGKYTMLASIGVPLGTFIYWGVSRLPIPLLLSLDFVLMGIGFMLMGRAADPISYAWGSFVNQTGCGIVLPTMLVWATRGLRYEVRGRGIGLWQAAFAVGQFLSGLVVTYVSAHGGGLLATFWFMGEAALAFALTAALVGMALPRAQAPQGEVH
jgi:MFS family permease